MHDSVMLATLLAHARKDGFSWLSGLEVSTKSELLLVLAVWHHLSDEEDDRDPHSKRMKVICNGWKDFEYLELVDIAQVKGLDIVVIMENEWDAQFVIDTYSRHTCSKPSTSTAESTNCCRLLPILGIRVKLQTQHSGRCAARTLCRKNCPQMLSHTVINRASIVREANSQLKMS
jgi:arginine decarboxylase-like protein